MLQRKTTDARVDGRRVRGADNRRRIVDALLKLVEHGTVDSLYREVSERMQAEIQPIIVRPFKSDDPRERLAELVDRRAQVFERLLPFKMAGDAHRHGSPYLTREQGAIVKAIRQALRNALGAKFADDKTRFEALDLMLCFESWRRLRVDQGLSARDARAVMLFGAESLAAKSSGR
jgi:hypothetical protein